MTDLLTDVILRIGQADGVKLRAIYEREIKAPIFTEEERRILTNAFDNRATALNAEDIDLSVNPARWKGMGAR